MNISDCFSTILALAAPKDEPRPASTIPLLFGLAFCAWRSVTPLSRTPIRLPWMSSPIQALIYLIALACLLLFVQAFRPAYKIGFKPIKAIKDELDTAHLRSPSSPMPLSPLRVRRVPPRALPDSPRTPVRDPIQHSVDMFRARSARTITFEVDAALVKVKESPPRSPIPRSPWKLGRSILRCSSDRRRPVKSVSFNEAATEHRYPPAVLPILRHRPTWDPEGPLDRPVPKAKSVTWNERVVFEEYPKWMRDQGREKFFQKKVLKELVELPPKLLPTAVRDTDGDIEMD